MRQVVTTVPAFVTRFRGFIHEVRFDVSWGTGDGRDARGPRLS
jgi:hypothetical protein